MKIAFTTEKATKESEIYSRFGRTKFFLIYDTDTKNFYSIDNQQNLNLPQGAGIQSAQNLANENINVILTGNVGPKAFKVLKEYNIKIYTQVTGKIIDALEKFSNNELTETEKANVESHW